MDEVQDLEARAAWTSALIYIALSLGLSLVFLVATLVNGKDYPLVARVGGMVWVFILSLIITMPLVIPAVKKRLKG